jgi:hypothetical protein
MNLFEKESDENSNLAADTFRILTEYQSLGFEKVHFGKHNIVKIDYNGLIEFLEPENQWQLRFTLAITDNEQNIPLNRVDITIKLIEEGFSEIKIVVTAQSNMELYNEDDPGSNMNIYEINRKTALVNGRNASESEINTIIEEGEDLLEQIRDHILTK